jgi:conjugative relaxase-like TrwC/TraI family protein
MERLRMHGGIKIYRGSPAAARHYVEADRSRADDYYLAEGTGLADRFVVYPDGALQRPAMDGDTYERWVAGYDVETGKPKGRLRTADNAVRFVEVVVNGPKSWSLAAAVHPEIAAAYDTAQDRAAGEIIRWLAQHSTTRVGPRGRQIQIPIEQLEAARIRHHTSRAGDPHRHLHLQVNAKVWAAGKWRAIHTVGVRDSLGALNGIGHAAVMCDPAFRAALAAHGYHLDETGEVVELAGFTGAFSARTTQIARNVDRYEAVWRTEHPGEEPGPRLRRVWDARAWAEARPDKVVPRDGAELGRRWVEELLELGFRPPDRPAPRSSVLPGAIDRTEAVELVLTRLGAARSAWNGADIRGEVERHLAASGLATDPSVRGELAEDLTDRVTNACVQLLDRDDVPEHVRALTSPEVLAVEEDLTTRLTRRAQAPVVHGNVLGEGLDPTQRRVVAALAGRASLLVIEGAAGTGKTSSLAAARTELAARGARLVVVTPTRKAAQIAAQQIGTSAFSAAWLAHQYGFRWDDDGHWSRDVQPPDVNAQLWPGDVLLIDEAGMLDQDPARALLTIADETGARIGFMGDRHQLPAVGRGGVLDLAARWAPPDACLTLDTIHRFADPAYAELSLLMRTGERSGEVFDALLDRGQIVIHATDVELTQSLATEGLTTDDKQSLLIADTREKVSALNAAVRDSLVANGRVDDLQALTTNAGQRIGIGDRVATRQNDQDLDVANREIWTVTGLAPDGGLLVESERGQRQLPASYVAEHLDLAYASTAHGAQGETVAAAHLLVSDQTSAASAYVGMTRGRQANTAHLVADSPDEAKRVWMDTFSRDRADLGPAHAAEAALSAIERDGTSPPHPEVALQRAALTGSLLSSPSNESQIEPNPRRDLRTRSPGR